MTPPAQLLALALLLAPPISLAAELSKEAASEIELGLGRDMLDKGYENWNDAYLSGAHRFGERHSVFGRLRQIRHYGQHDREISGGYYYPLGEAWTALIEASVSPGHNVLPKNTLLGQLQKSFGDGWGAHAGYRRSWYNTESASLIMLTGERYWSDYRAAYTLYLGKLPGAATAPSHRGQINYYYSNRSAFTLGYAKGRQVESLGSGLGLLTNDVTSISLSGLHWLSPAWGISYEAIRERQGDLYTRKGVRVGLRHAF